MFGTTLLWSLKSTTWMSVRVTVPTTFTTITPTRPV
eukprot:gene4209-3002_t